MGISPRPALPPRDPNSNPELSLTPVLFPMERQALERLLASGEFHRSPNLEKILSYLCHQYFQGKGNLVKEYTIAIEALDRKEDFDPKRDSIVRVEMHRLRRRLKEYYSSKGAANAIRINLPEKSYIPEFVTVATVAIEPGLILDTPQTAALSLPHEPNSVWVRVKQHRNDAMPVWLAVIALAMVSIAGFWWWTKPAASLPLAQQPLGEKSSSPTAASLVELNAPSATSPGTELRILAGRPKGRYPDRYGVVWQGDDYFVGGKSIAIESEVRARGFDSNVFAGMREGDFRYEIPLKPGVYEMTLLFAETVFGEGNVFGGGESSRQFFVHINGKVELSNYDALSEAHDPSTATARSFKDLSPGPDGKLRIRFEPSQIGKAFVNGIIIRPGVKGHIRPIRIVCRPHIYRDSYGEVWEPDRYFRGGTQITRPTGAYSAKDPDLFRGERYGKFSYSIPVPPGKYQARLYFVEYWWGPNSPGLGGVGSRIFDVFCNFRPLLSKLDIIQRNSKERLLMETFHGLEPNLDSQLVFDFEPRINFALVNAIEIAEDNAVLPIH